MSPIAQTLQVVGSDILFRKPTTDPNRYRRHMGDSPNVDQGAIQALSERIQREVDDGRIPAGQMALALNGELIHSENFADATDDTRFNVYSCTKALIAGVVWQLIGEGSLSSSTAVTDLVPSFTAADGMTLEHLLTHTGGFPYAPLAPPRWDTREARLQQFGRWNLQWDIGERFEYHATSAHWVVAEMIEVIEGRDYRDVVRDRMLIPLGLNEFTLGSPAGEVGEVAELKLVGAVPTAAEIEEVFGIPNVDLGEVTPEILLGFNEPSAREVGVPGGGGIATAASLAMLYQGFLHNPGEIWDPEVLADGTQNVRCILPDPLKQIPANRTLGLILGGDDGNAHMRGMGHTNSPRTFGHGGAAGQISWADPVSGLSFGFVTSGVEKNFIRENRRSVAITSRAGSVIQT